MRLKYRHPGLEILMELGSAYLVLAAVFGFLMAWGIGANDVSNAMGTSVGSGAISLKQAILIATICEFCGAFFAGSEVTSTIQQGIVNPTFFVHDPQSLILGMLAALLAAGLWLLVASLFGWPVSTTHTIVGAIVGFGMMQGGTEVIQWLQVLSIVSSWLISPILGGVLGFLLFFSVQRLILNQSNPIHQAKFYSPLYIFITCFVVGALVFPKLSHFGLHLTTSFILLYNLLTSAALSVLGYHFIARLHISENIKETESPFIQVEKIFSILMVFTACAMAFAHGSNDVANAIGPVASIASLVDNSGINQQVAQIPTWVLLLGALGILVGLATYGHKVIATVGSGITQLTPSRGFCATLAAASTVVLASSTGLPISTTHTLVGAILGIGLARGMQALNLRVIGKIFMSWVITLPVGAGLAIALYYGLDFCFSLL